MKETELRSEVDPSLSDLDELEITKVDENLSKSWICVYLYVKVIKFQKNDEKNDFLVKKKHRLLGVYIGIENHHFLIIKFTFFHENFILLCVGTHEIDFLRLLHV